MAKADILKCLEPLAEKQSVKPDVSAIILDGPAIVNMLKPPTKMLFSEYVNTIFIPYLENNLKNVNRVDVIWDDYHTNSLKASTREHRGSGIRRRVTAVAMTPTSWSDFLRHDQNKVELFAYLSESVVMHSFHEKVVEMTYKSSVKSWPAAMDVSALMPCSHEEADTRLFVHLADMYRQGHRNIQIRTVDSDVVVIAISEVCHLEGCELWIAFGVGTSFRYIPAHSIADNIGLEKATSLPFFHAFTGCDTVSCFSGKGKKTAWETWSSFPDATEAFLHLSCSPESLCMDSRIFIILQSFVCLMYDRTTMLNKTNELRKELFSKKCKDLESIPPTENALLQHSKRASFQAGYCWGQSTKPDPKLPSPTDWGWKQRQDGDTFIPLWTNLPEAAEACYELIKYGCKVSCQGNCKCHTANLKCTALCNCGGNCFRDDN